MAKVANYYNRTDGQEWHIVMVMENNAMTCYGQINGNGWTQEWYETSTRDAGKRARQLRKLGYRVTVSGQGSQVTNVGRVNMTLVDIRGDYGQMGNLPEVTKVKL